MAEHPKWGFLASCPTNVGTGMRASVHVKIPLVSSLPCFKELCRDMDMDIRGKKYQQLKIMYCPIGVNAGQIKSTVICV